MYVKDSKQSKPESAVNTNVNTGTEQTNSQPLTPATAFKNGTYTAAGDYMTPGGKEQITITVTIANDTIVSTTAMAQAKAPASKEFMAKFVDNYKSHVVGKKIAEVKLDKISGSSLTPKGFNAALEKIKAQAKS